MANEIVYEIKADPKSADEAIKKIDSSAKQSAGSGGGIGALTSSLANVGTVAMAAAAAFVTYFVGQALREGIQGAIEQENAINRMNNSLALAGRLSMDASHDMQNFANEMQRTTILGDDAVLTYIALGSAFTKSNDQTKQLTRAAIDLSSAMGVSVETAVRSLGGSLSGVTGMLGKIIPDVRSLTEEQLKAGAAIDLVSKRFGGAAALAANTYSGRIEQLKNVWGDMLEEFGNFFVKSDALRTAFKFITDAVLRLTDRVKGFRENSGDIFKPLLIGAANVAEFFTFVLGPIVEFVYNIFDTLGRHVGRVAAIMAEAFTGNFVGAFELAKQEMQDGIDFNQIFSTKGTEGAMNFIEGFKEQIAASQGIIQEVIAPIEKPNFGPNLEDTEKAQEHFDILTLAYESFVGKVLNLNAKVRSSWLDMRKTLFTTMVNGFQSAFNAMGAALVNGGNAFDAFGKAMLGMFGQLASQLGMFFFLEGIAFLVGGNYAKGAALMAAGGALMVFGGVLQALSGGGAGATGASAGGAGGAGGAASSTVGDVGDNTTGLSDTAARERQTNIEVNIQGNVLGDKRTLGLEIADALNEAFGNDGIIIARGALS
mgnify:FL=1